jgi:hypothetical protein
VDLVGIKPLSRSFHGVKLTYIERISEIRGQNATFRKVLELFQFSSFQDKVGALPWNFERTKFNQLPNISISGHFLPAKPELD